MIQPRLPPELYRLIIEYIDGPSALRAVLLISRDWYHEVERCLYGRISTVLPPGCCKTTKQADRKRIQYEEMLLRVSQSPRLGLLLVHLNLHGVDKTFGDRPFFLRSWTGFIPALSLTCLNLRSLELPSRHPQPFLPPTTALFKLRIFKFDRSRPYAIGKIANFRADVERFLESQPMIQELALPPWICLLSLNPGTLLNLRVLSACTSNCAILLPGRRVEEVVMTHGLMLSTFNVFDPIPSLKNVILFSFMLERLQLFSRSFIYFEHLDIGLVCLFS